MKSARRDTRTGEVLGLRNALRDDVIHQPRGTITDATALERQSCSNESGAPA